MENGYIRLIREEEKAQLRIFFDKYLTELSQYIPHIEFDANGKPIYRWFDRYWIDNDRYPYYLIVDGVIAGFVLVRKLSECRIEIAEFCVLEGYRHSGNGRQMLDCVMQEYGGYEIELSAHIDNLPAVNFWDNTLDNIDRKYMFYDKKWKYYILNYKTVKLHKMNLQAKYFDLIDQSIKVIEGRLNDEKRQNMRAGDLIVFASPDRDYTVTTIILQRKEYPNFEEMINDVELSDLGLGDCSRQDACNVYREIYSQDDECRYGVVALHIAKCYM